MLGFGAETSDYSQTGNVAADVTGRLRMDYL